MDTLVLPVKWDSPRQETEDKKVSKLGDGYQQNCYTPNSDRASWRAGVILGATKFNSTIALLNNYAGGVAFLWRFSPEDELKPFTCKQYEVTRLGLDAWQLNVNFDEFRGE